MKFYRFVAFVISLSLITCLTGCSSKASKEKDNGEIAENLQSSSSENHNTTNNTTDNKNPSDGIENTDTDSEEMKQQKIVITNLINDFGEYTDDVGNLYRYSYVLPLISGTDTDYVERINSGIQEIKANYIDSEYENMKYGASLITYEVDYEYFELNDVISLVIHLYNDWDIKEYYCYNLTKYGNLISNDKLLAAKGISREEFLSTAKELMGERVNFDDTLFDEETKKIMQELRDKTLSDKNINMTMPMYIGPEGTICFIGTVYSFAGADSYDYIFDTGL